MNTNRQNNKKFAIRAPKFYLRLRPPPRLAPRPLNLNAPRRDTAFEAVVIFCGAKGFFEADPDFFGLFVSNKRATAG